jgi:hypothetical protein
MLLSPVGEFVSELLTSEIPERIMKHGVLLIKSVHLFHQLMGNF